MLDIHLIRADPENIKANIERRKDIDKLKAFHVLVERDREYRDILKMVESLRAQRNRATNEINEARKQKQDITQAVAKAKGISEQIKGAEEKLSVLRKEVDAALLQLPNLMHESVPYGKDDTENVEVRAWGKPLKPKFDLKSHGEIAESLGVADFDRAAKIAGKGFYFLMGDLALLNQALIRFAVDELVKKGFLFVEPPYMLSRRAVDGVTDFETFRNSVYKVEDEDLHLVATSEHPLMALHMDETIPDDLLPMRFVGYSPCFRREIGSHGIDEKGFFRVHQFFKVEQVIICAPEQSWKLHEELMKNSEDLFRKLKLPYRVVNICTGDLGMIAAKKYDLEVWMPRQQKYREACSASNCTDYQARRLNIRYGTPGAPQNPFVHSLNNTAIATSRVLVAILENFQQKDGSVKIPSVLHKYMNGVKVLRSQLGVAKKTKGSERIKKR